MNHGRNRSRSPADDYSKRSLLRKVDKRELEAISIKIRRHKVVGSDKPLERNIIDPEQISIVVHIRKSAPRVPIFSGDIKVNRVFCEDRTVFTYSRDRRRSRSASNYRSRSRSYNERRSEERRRNRSRSRRKSRSRHRSRSRERRTYRSKSRSRSRSRSFRPTQKSYDSYEHKRRSITPLRPGEYRPGHPDLALRKQRSLSRTRSSSKYSTSREASVKCRQVYRSPTRSPTKPVPMMQYDFYKNYGQFCPMNPMVPYRPVTPGFYPQLCPHTPQMMPHMQLPGYPRMPMFRHHLPDYKSLRRTATSTTAIGEKERGSEIIVEQSSDGPEQADSMEISSSNQKCESDGGASEAVTE